ncbi:thioesterase II family protein [Streptosporangium sp. NPDC049376]
MTEAVPARRSAALPCRTPVEGSPPLFLLPAAGGSTTLYRDWPDALGPGVTPCPVEPPGRGRRMATPPFTDLAELAGVLDEELTPPAGSPWALLGHSMGALAAVAWAARAHRRGRSPSVLYLSAAAPPWLHSTAEPLVHLDDDGLWRHMLGLGGLPAEVAGNDTARRLLTPLIRADVRAAASWRPAAAVAVGCPVVAFVGARETEFQPSLALEWRSVATGGFAAHVLPGGHFYRHGLTDLLPVVSADLIRRFPPAEPS